MATKRNENIKNIVLLAILTSLIIFMTVTGFAYIPINPVFKITLLTVPVAIGSVILGVSGGTFLGAVFGLTSFFTCFGLDPFGSILLTISPLKTFVFCVIPRIICGFIPAIIVKYVKNKNLSVPLACVTTSVINTVGFLTTLWLCFGNDILNNAQIVSYFAKVGIVIDGIIALFVVFAGVNAIIEAVAGLVVGTACSRVIMNFFK